MGRALMIILIFVVVGPLVGLVTISGVVTVVAAANQGEIQAIEKSMESDDPVALGFAILFLGSFFAHFFGALWAALAGAVVAARASLWGPASIFEGVPVGVLTALASIVFYDIGKIDVDPGTVERATVQLAAGWALTHIVAAMVCIWLTRRWQTREAGTS